MEKIRGGEEQVFRSRIYWLNGLFSIFVIWIHSYNVSFFLEAEKAAGLVEWVENLIGEELGQIAVPGFFMVSAWLFYRSFSWDRLLPKWKSRVRSLLLPYISWNLLYYLAYALSGWMGGNPVPVNPAQLVRAAVFYAYNPVFWYLFQLILLTALAPLLFLLLQRTWTGMLWLFFLLTAIRQLWDFPLVNEDALFYYSWAAFAALHRESWGRGAKRLLSERAGGGRPALLLGAALCLTGAGLWLAGREGGVLWNSVLAIVLRRLWGVHAALLLVSCLPLWEAPAWMRNSFFLYAAHYLWVRMFTRMGALAAHGSPAAALALYLGMPALIVPLLCFVFRLLRRHAPKLCSVLSGAREAASGGR